MRELLIIIVIFCIYNIYVAWVELSKLTKEQLDELGDIVMHFHENPNREEFEKVYKNKEALIDTSGKMIKFWLWGVHMQHPEYFTTKMVGFITSHTNEINRDIRRVIARPTPELLDCIWALYFATGSIDYPEIIKKIALKCPNAEISGAATWSYESIMGASPFAAENSEDQ